MCRRWPGNCCGAEVCGAVAPNDMAGCGRCEAEQACARCEFWKDLRALCFWPQGLEGRESVAVIVDDSVSVWKEHAENLLAVERYVFFPATLKQFNIRRSSFLELNKCGALACSMRFLCHRAVKALAAEYMGATEGKLSHPFIHSSVCPSVHPSMCPSTHLSLSPSMGLLAYPPSGCLSVRLCIGLAWGLRCAWLASLPL
jgi:hypothetical protein